MSTTLPNNLSSPRSVREMSEEEFTGHLCLQIDGASPGHLFNRTAMTCLLRMMGRQNELLARLTETLSDVEQNLLAISVSSNEDHNEEPIQFVAGGEPNEILPSESDLLSKAESAPLPPVDTKMAEKFAEQGSSPVAPKPGEGSSAGPSVNRPVAKRKGVR